MTFAFCIAGVCRSTVGGGQYGSFGAAVGPPIWQLWAANRRGGLLSQAVVGRYIPLRTFIRAYMYMHAAPINAAAVAQTGCPIFRKNCHACFQLFRTSLPIYCRFTHICSGETHMLSYYLLHVPLGYAISWEFTPFGRQARVRPRA